MKGLLPSSGLRLLLRGTARGAAFAALVAAVLSACVGDGRDSNKAWGTGHGAGGFYGSGGSGPSGSGGDPLGCEEGEVRSCHVTIGRHNDVLTCFVGEQRCQDGAWGPCGDGVYENSYAPGPDLAPTAAAGQWQALSSAVDCEFNPCDPTCQEYDEVPDGGLGVDGQQYIYDWNEGYKGSLPPAVYDLAFNEPCREGSDCQMNHYCSDPNRGSCEHPPCAIGDPLTYGCSPCVKDVCDSLPQCCKFPYAGSCEHSPCTTGNGLKKACDPIVRAVCDNDDMTCCPHQVNVFGYWFDVPGSWREECIGFYQQRKPGACDPGDWSQACVDAISSACGAFCPADPKGRGECLPWGPEKTNPGCNSIDLAVGIPCDDSIPVCNHGTTTAPAGVTLKHYPAGSGAFKKANPSGTPGEMTCTTKAEIPPGTCINVTDCGGLTSGREIMVNPPGATHLDECFGADNWSVYVPGICGPPTCAGENIRAEIRPVNMFISVDKSGSMQGARWNGTKAAFQAFFKDPAAAGLNIGLEFWSHSGCGSNCNSASACAIPHVPFGTLLVQNAPTDTQEQQLVSAFNAFSPSGSTPAYPAYEGAVQWGLADAVTNPDALQIIVFVTDGYPTDCNTSNAAFAALAQQAYDQAGVRTYGIGIVGADTAMLTGMANAGGGQAYFISSDSAVEKELIDAMNAIKGDAVSCDILLPAAAMEYDPEDAEIIYTPGDGSPPITLSRKKASAECGNGWYYDDNDSPTLITLCPNTCTAVQNDLGAKVDLSFGCPGAYEVTSHTQVYEATCSKGQSPQWGYLSYDTVTPSTSKALFEARTARTEGELAAASFVPLATAQADPDTQVCPMSGPAPCPIDLMSKLGEANALAMPWLELRVTNTPNKAKNKGPLVNDYQITYSCPDSE